MIRILLTNDDGINAPGLAAARRALQRFGPVTTVVPDREMSGVSHALTLNHPLRVQQVAEDTYVVNGTPTDCVNLALHRILAARPRLVFSGINRGSNVGYDVTYSGTVAAAYEGALHGVPAMAVSIEAAGDLERAELGATTAALVETLLASGREGLVNVNFPAGEIRGLKVTLQGHGGYRSEVIEKLDPRGNRYYWIGGRHAHDSEARPEADLVALREGFVSITPLTLDLTDHAARADLDRLFLPVGSPERR